MVLVEPAAAGAWGAVDRAAIATVRQVIATERGSLDAELAFDDLLAADPSTSSRSSATPSRH